MASYKFEVMAEFRVRLLATWQWATAELPSFTDLGAVHTPEKQEEESLAGKKWHNSLNDCSYVVLVLPVCSYKALL